VILLALEFRGGIQHDVLDLSLHILDPGGQLAVRRTHLETIILIGHMNGPQKFGSLRFVEYLLNRHVMLFTPANG